jgi:hypothetical protein
MDRIRVIALVLVGSIVAAVLGYDEEQVTVTLGLQLPPRPTEEPHTHFEVPEPPALDRPLSQAAGTNDRRAEVSSAGMTIPDPPA